MFLSLDLFVLSCLFLSAESQTGHILPPGNLSVLWLSDFEPQLSWEPPPHSVENCRYDVTSFTGGDSKATYKSKTSRWQSYFIAMAGGSLHLAVKTVCNGTTSEAAVFNVTYPDLVRNLKCCVYSSNRTNCSWDLPSQTPEPRFFYRLQNERNSGTNDNSQQLQECLSYHYTSGARTGCDLHANGDHAIHILFNGTLNNALVRNTFRKYLALNVCIPRINWTVYKTKDKFMISWIPPDIMELSQWTFTINYTECNEAKVIHIPNARSAELELVSHCPYRMVLKAGIHSESGPWSDEKHFGADTDPNASLYPLIIIPLMCAGLAALAFVCYRKNKENIFPKVPEPRDLLSDIFDNNNKSTVRNLYIPAEEEDNCKITLVIDPQINEVAKH